MKFARTHLKCTIEDDFLRDCLVLYTETELATSISNDEIIEA
jgi:hypothetical protein